jgi:hypothetical protein
MFPVTATGDRCTRIDFRRSAAGRIVSYAETTSGQLHNHPVKPDGLSP